VSVYISASKLPKLSRGQYHSLLSVAGPGRLISLGVSAAEGYHYFRILVDPGTASQRTLPSMEPSNNIIPTGHLVGARGALANGSITLDLPFERGLSVEASDDGADHQRSTYWVIWEG
jgi:hypothetical protein